VELRVVEEDLGPASKVLHAAREFSGTECRILFCDDDRIYRPGWATRLFDAQAERPGDCVAAMGRNLSEIIGTTPAARRFPRALIGRHYPDPRYRLQRLRQHLAEVSLQPKAPKPLRRPVARSGYADILLGYAGAVVRPHFFPAEAFRIAEEAWMVDDIWLSGQLTRNGVGIWVPKRPELPLKSGNDARAALRDAVFAGLGRDGCNRQAIRYFQQTYGVWS
jgi:hypothetical protein